MEILIVGAAGAAGAVARYWLALLLVTRLRLRVLPAATLIVNVAGSFALGLVLGLLFAEVPPGADLLADRTAVVLATGFCGSFTTFSTFATDVGHLLRGRQAAGAALYVCSTVAGVVAAFLAGLVIAS